MSQHQFRVEPAELRAYASYMRDLACSFDSVTRFVRGEGANVSGFTGLLAVLTPAVTLAGEVVGAALGIGMDRLQGAAEGLERSARSYDTTDVANAAMAGISGATVMPDIPERLGRL